MSVSLSTSSSSSDDDSILNYNEFLNKKRMRLAQMKIINSKLSPEKKIEKNKSYYNSLSSKKKENIINNKKEENLYLQILYYLMMTKI